MTAPRPYTLIAELTYRCPLRCPYCSNPLDLAADRDEMTTEQWSRVLGEAESMGVLQLHLTGGEPLARKDLEALVRRGRELDLYVNLITSGVPLERDRLAGLRDAGLDALQLSVQGVDAAACDRVAGYPSFDAKMRVAAWARELDLPLTMNMVLHRDNLDRVAEAIALAERIGAHRVELANTQYLGWALPNRDALLPARAPIDRARAVAEEARARLAGRMEVLFVVPDYFRDAPRACMDGWARRFVHVTPAGFVLPCHAARSITSLAFESARDRSLAEIWESSPALRAYRGHDWMPDPCRTCARKEQDHGGCRCQSFALTGDAGATDPACALSPRHALVAEARARGEAEEVPRRYLYRGSRGSAA